MEPRTTSGGLMLDQCQSHQVGEWSFKTFRSHILNSKCTSSFICKKTRETIQTKPNESGTPRKTFDEYYSIKSEIANNRQICQHCKYDLILSMAHLPDMTYASNYLRLSHRKSGLILEFNTLDSLAPVIVKSYGLPIGLKVSASEAWLRARMDCEYTRNVCNADFDWTFSSDYPGSFQISSENNVKDLREDQPPLKDLIETNCQQRIDMEKLKIRKQINFFDEVELFEDELADHGVAQMSVKIRVHDDSFYILCRFFLRVDRVFVRYFDTRLYHEFTNDYIIRERSNHESTIQDLNLPEDIGQAILINPQELFQYVPQKYLQVDRIQFPDGKIV